MKALVYEGIKRIDIKDVPIPDIDENEALIKVHWAGICGSDIVVYKGGFKRVKPPVVLGHEFTGEIADISNPKLFLPGDKVVIEPIISCEVCELCRTGKYNICRNSKVIGIDRDGGFAEYVKVPVNRIHKLPDTLDLELAALTEPVAVAIHMIKKAGLKFGDSVLVLGAGPIGLLVALVAMEAGISKIAITDINNFRLELASEYGLNIFNAADDAYLDKLKKYFGERGSDITFELAAVQETLNVAAEITKINGTILAGGMFKVRPTINMQQMAIREQKYIGSRLYNFLDFQAAIDFVVKKKDVLRKMITEHLTIDEGIKGFKKIIAGENIMKILLNTAK